MRAAPPPADPFAIARPFLWLAALAFMVGFVGYLVLGHPHVAPAAHGRLEPASASGPASADWNLPKRI